MAVGAVVTMNAEDWTIPTGVRESEDDAVVPASLFDNEDDRSTAIGKEAPGRIPGFSPPHARAREDGDEDGESTPPSANAALKS